MRLAQQTCGMGIYYVYMLRCFDGTFYVGVTNDIERRYAEHRAGHDPRSYTALRRPRLTAGGVGRGGGPALGQRLGRGHPVPRR